MPTPSAATSPTPTRRRSAFLLAFLLATVLATSACPGNVSHTYKSFQSAVDRGASCSELFDQRDRFQNDDTLRRIDRELDRIGCTSRDAARSDR